MSDIPHLGKHDIRIDRTTLEGDSVWSRHYGNTEHEYYGASTVLPEGDILVVGTTTTQSQGISDVLLLRIDLEGEVIWSKTYGGPGAENGLAVHALVDGRMLVAGRMNDGSSGTGDDAFVTLLDIDGDVMWSTTVGGGRTG